MIVLLLSAFGAALIVSALACLVALRLFPWFRSDERKTGDFKPDQSGGSSGSQQIEIVSGKAKRSQARLRSSELPLVGGVAMVFAVVTASGVAGYLLNFSLADWELLGVLMAAFLGFAVVGFIDDARKVHKGSGISELQKFIGVFLVASVAAAGLNRLLASPALSARLAYSPYKDLPFLGSVLVNVHYTWLTFFLILTVSVTTTTSLAVDFSDGVDGLCGGLLLSASLSYAVILLDEGATVLWPLTVALLAIAGATLGYLPFNWPSSWRGGAHPNGKRRAKLIMGDTGSLALGGLLALIAIVSRLELLLILIGGAFVLEGISALMQGRVLVQLFRRSLFVERFNSAKGFPHTEFPLPFLATPMHHHYELLGWDRRRLVYGAWLLGAGLGVLGIASVMGPFTWERYLARFAGFLLLLLVWQVGPWTRTFFVGLTPVKKDKKGKENPDAPRYLALYYGAPYKLFGWPLYARIDVTHATPEAFSTTAERLSLWQLMSVFDARSLLGYYCYQAEQFDDALRIWDRIPKTNLRMRPEISQLLTETRHRLAVETVGGDAPLSRVVNDGAAPLTEIPDVAAPTTATSPRTSGAPVVVAAGGSLIANGAATRTGNRVTPRVTPAIRTIGQMSQLAQSGQAGQRVTGAPVSRSDTNAGATSAAGEASGVASGANADPNASAWRMSRPTTGIHSIPRLQPTDGQAIPETTVTPAPAPSPQEAPGTDEPVLWSVSAWTAAHPVHQDEEPDRQTAPLPIITTPLDAIAGATPDESATTAAPTAAPAAPLTVAPTPPSQPLIVPTLTPSEVAGAAAVETATPGEVKAGATPTQDAQEPVAAPGPVSETPALADAPLTEVTATLAVAQDTAEAPTAPRVAKVAGAKNAIPTVTDAAADVAPTTPAQEDDPSGPSAPIQALQVANAPDVAKTDAQNGGGHSPEPAPFVPPTLDTVILTADGGEAAN